MNDNTLFDGYDRGSFYDEMFDAEGGPRHGVTLLAERLAELGPPELLRRQRTAERALLSAGITFQVYGAGEGTERVLPFDLVPRVIEPHDWAPLERGIQQRIVALNHFVGDIYGEQRILKDGVVPTELVASASSYLKPCHGIVPVKKVYTHITGTDLVRDKDGQFYVLEDNLRCPSGVSYVLQNQQVMKRTLPHAFNMSRVRPVDGYASHLLSLLRAMAPPTTKKPTIVLLTPGHAQLGLLRARLPGAADGDRAGRGARSAGGRRAGGDGAPPGGWRRSTSSTGASTTPISTPRPSIRARSWACPASSTCTARARSRW